MSIIQKSMRGCQRRFGARFCRAKNGGFIYNKLVVRGASCRGGGATEEKFDILDCRGSKTGQVIPRDEAHKSGVWHGAFHCLIVGERGGRPFALFQKRSARKTIAPGKYDVTAGGHYASGEDATTAGPREIREEIGLDVPFTALLPVGRRVFVYCFTPGVTECEFQDVFLLLRTVEPAGLLLQEEELDGMIELDVEQGIALFSGKIAFVNLALHKPNGSTADVRVAARDFVPCLDNYYHKMLLLARRYFLGERDTLFI